MCDVILLCHVINSVIHPWNKSSISPEHNKLEFNLFHDGIYTIRQTRVFENSTKFPPYARQRSVFCTHGVTLQWNLFMTILISLYFSTWQKKIKKKKKTRTEPVREKVQNAEKSNTGREFQVTYRLLTTPRGQGVTAPHTLGIFSIFFLKRHNSYWPLATLTQIKVTYHVSLDVTPQFRLQTQCNYTSHRTGGHNSRLLRNFFKIFFLFIVTFCGRSEYALRLRLSLM